MRNTHRTLCAALALATSPLTQAHDIWLLPSTTVLSRAGYITLDAAVSNDTFHFTYRPLRLRDNLVISGPEGTSVEAENLVQGELRTVFDAELPQDGSYSFAVVHGGVFASWEEDGETQRWRGTREDMAANVPEQAKALSVRETAGRIETFVSVGAPTELGVSGSGLELQPITHPNDLYAGETATFRFLADGEPIAGAKVSIQAGGTRYRDRVDKQLLETDTDGHIAYTWPAPGLYWLNAVVQDENTELHGAERRLNYAATLEVLPQ